MEKPDFTVRVEPAGWTYTATAEASVMQSARLAGIDFPASCRNGTCRTCICRLQQGQVRYSVEWPGLSSDEKREGLILPCVAYAQSDLVLAVPNARPLRKT